MKNFKKFLCLILSLILIVNISSITYAERLFNVEAESAILIDVGSGQIIYEKNIHDRKPPASITKIMLLLLTMESLQSGKINLNDEVVISENASSMGGSQVYLEPGGTNTVNELLTAVALRSANDAAVALGEHIAGTEETFVGLMNERAKQLKMENTNFMNITGLPDDKHYTTAYDISIMSRELLKHTKIHEWLTQWMSTIMVGKNKDVEQSLSNTNKLIRFYKGANGIKTGYTSKAGHCLSASATRGNLTLVSVVLSCKTSNIRFNESKKLLDYGFANYNSIPICKEGNIIKKTDISKGKEEFINIVAKNNLSLLIKKGTTPKINKEYLMPECIESPIKKGQKIGEMIIKIEDKEHGRVDLISDRDVNRANVLDMFKKIFSDLL